MVTHTGGSLTSVVRIMPLVSNGFALSDAPDRLGRLIPTEPSRPRDELWEQFQALGFPLVHLSNKGLGGYRERGREPR